MIPEAVADDGVRRKRRSTSLAPVMRTPTLAETVKEAAMAVEKRQIPPVSSLVEKTKQRPQELAQRLARALRRDRGLTPALRQDSCSVPLAECL